MQRNILIIDDHDDLATSLEEVFTATGHGVRLVERREDALAIDDIERYDLVITDLDVVSERGGELSNGNGHSKLCLPDGIIAEAGEHVKAFKICAANFRRDEFDEEELKNFVATILDFKSRYIDKIDLIQDLHENIECELPSAI